MRLRHAGGRARLCGHAAWRLGALCFATAMMAGCFTPKQYAEQADADTYGIIAEKWDPLSLRRFYCLLGLGGKPPGQLLVEEGCREVALTVAGQHGDDHQPRIL